MRNPSLRRLFVVLAKIARRMKKLRRDDGSLEVDVTERIEQRLAARNSDARAVPREMGHVVKSFMCSVKAGVPFAKQRPHVRRDQGIGNAVINGLALDIAQVQRASNMEINDLMVADQRANARLTRGVFKSDKSHRNLPAGECSDFIKRNQRCLSRRSGEAFLVGPSCPWWLKLSAASWLLIIRLLKQTASPGGADPVFAQHLVLC